MCGGFHASSSRPHINHRLIITRSPGAKSPEPRFPGTTLGSSLGNLLVSGIPQGTISYHILFSTAAYDLCPLSKPGRIHGQLERLGSYLQRMVLPLALPVGVLLPSIEYLPISYRVFVGTAIYLPFFILKRISQATLNVARGGARISLLLFSSFVSIHV